MYIIGEVRLWVQCHVKVCGLDECRAIKTSRHFSMNITDEADINKTSTSWRGLATTNTNSVYWARKSASRNGCCVHYLVFLICLLSSIKYRFVFKFKCHIFQVKSLRERGATFSEYKIWKFIPYYCYLFSLIPFTFHHPPPPSSHRPRNSMLLNS